VGSAKPWVVGVLSLVMCGGAVAQGQSAPSLSTNLDVAYVTRYVWRGIPQTEEGAIQPSFTLSHPSGWSVNLWASEDIDAGQMRENDYTLSYAWDSGPVAMNAGYIYYAFPNTSYVSTSEIYATACFGGAFSPSVSVNCDIDEASGFYASLGTSYAWPVSLGGGRLTDLKLSGRLSFSSAGYNKFWFGGAEKAALSDVYLSASAPVSLSASTSLTPSISYSTVIDSALRDALSSSGLDPSNVVGSLTLSCGF
jgi:hypothetical protein